MYKSLLTLVIAFLLSCSLLAQSNVQSGKFNADPNTPGYTLDKNSGNRSVTIEVPFKKPFDVKPVIVLSVTTLDADKNTNSRYSIEAVSISRDGFTIKITTWADSKIFGIGGQWIAHNE